MQITVIFAILESVNMLNETDEVWKPIPGYEGLYSASSIGRVRSDRTATCTRAGRILRAVDRGNGYLFVMLYRDGTPKSLSIHRLVAAAFLGPCPAGIEVNHRNGKKPDNRLTNLEYATSSENQTHAFRTGLQSCAGERNGAAKLTPDIVRSIRATATGKRGEKAAFARRYGVDESTIREILKREIWPHL